MNLVIQKLTEINEALGALKKREMTTEEVQALVSLVNAAHKWANLVLQVFAIESKNKRVMKGLNQMNIVDEHTAIEIGIEASKVKCPDKNDSLISAEECLDYSGSHVDCGDCDIGKSVRKMILDK